MPEAGPTDTADAATVHCLGSRKNAAFNAVLVDEGIDAYADAIDFLDRLAAAGIRVAAVSSSRNGDDVLAAAGIRDRFRVLVVISAERGIDGKPAPDNFLAATRDLGVVPERAVVAEDATSGVEAGRGGGFALVLGVARDGDPDALLAAGADVVVASFSAVTIAGEKD